MAGTYNDLCDFSLCWILTEGAEEVADGLARDGVNALLVEERKCLLVL